MLKGKLNELIHKSKSLVGATKEREAQYFLENEGLIFVCRNFRWRGGEIDLIMRDNNTLVFIEVKYRKNNSFGGAVSAVTSAKKRRIVNTALYYLQTNFHKQISTRFDVVAITGNEAPNWIKNAFYSEG